jgi:hypothetical protein
MPLSYLRPNPDRCWTSRLSSGKSAGRAGDRERQGRLSASRAQALPDRRFLGIEYANKFFLYAADRMARWGMTNVRLMRTDARHL